MKELRKDIILSVADTIEKDENYCGNDLWDKCATIKMILIVAKPYEHPSGGWFYNNRIHYDIPFVTTDILLGGEWEMWQTFWHWETNQTAEKTAEVLRRICSGEDWRKILVKRGKI